MAKTNNGKWCIENEILSELISYDDGGSKPLKLGASWSIGQGFGSVKGILTWLVMRALKIERLPWMGDWPFTYISEEDKLKRALEYLYTHQREVDDACREIQDIYKNTQQWFTSREISTVKLGRGYKNDKRATKAFSEYANILLRQVQAAQHLGLNTVDIPHDVITSWGAGCEYTACVAGVELDIPVSDIFLGPELLERRTGSKAHRVMESGEWLVLNRMNNGLIPIPIAAVKTLLGHQVAPVSVKEAQNVYDKSIPALRAAIQFHPGYLQPRRVKQTFGTRLSLAWGNLLDTHH